MIKWTLREEEEVGWAGVKEGDRVVTDRDSRVKGVRETEER